MNKRSTGQPGQHSGPKVLRPRRGEACRGDSFRHQATLHRLRVPETPASTPAQDSPDAMMSDGWLDSFYQEVSCCSLNLSLKMDLRSRRKLSCSITINTSSAVSRDCGLEPCALLPWCRYACPTTNWPLATAVFCLRCVPVGSSEGPAAITGPGTQSVLSI